MVRILVRKQITITEEQDDWIKEHCINLSSLVQKTLDSRIEAKYLSEHPPSYKVEINKEAKK